MNLSIIVAMTDDLVIGREGRLPWRLSDDLKRFKRLTMGHVLLMGRKTYESIGRPLPGRRTIVLSRQAGLQGDGVELSSNMDEAVRIAEQGESQRELFVVGGAELYREALPIAQRIYMTRVHADVAGDTFFPPWNPSEWQVVEEMNFARDDKNDHATTFTIYERK